jgi:hypothetical protein
MPPNTNRGPAVDAGWVRLGGRKLAHGSCREEVVAVIGLLGERTGQQVFPVAEVYAEMVAAGTRYAESTIFKTMQRIRLHPSDLPSSGSRMSNHAGSGWLTES